MAETRITLPYHWAPRPYQQKLWQYLARGGLRAVACWPRRHGKDDVFLHHTACAMGERKGTYWYLLPEYSQARKSMWDAIDEEQGLKRIDLVFPPAIRTMYRDQEMMLGYGGSTFQLVGADNFNSLVGSPPVGLVFSEYARTDPSAWAYLMPILEKNGGWVGFNSTPYGTDNHYRKLCAYAEKTPGWFYQKLTAEDATVYSAAQLQTILAQLQDTHGEQYGRALFMQEYYTSFDAAFPGAIWADCVDRAEREGRIVDYDVNTEAKVNTAWDLGRTDDTSIGWYSILGKQIDVFDHWAGPGMDVCNEEEPHKGLVQLLLSRAKLHGITYGTHYLPHDARPRTQAAGGKSILQQFSDATRKYPELGRFVIGPRLDRQEGIQAARATFPYVRFHQTRTVKLRASLRHYHRKWDEETKMFLDIPVHDFASHDADMFRGLALSWKFMKPGQPESPLIDLLLAGNPAGQTMGAIRKRLLDRKRSEREWQMT